jgi:hypothetical protein
MPNRAAISLQYSSLERFFKAMLGVESPDMSMHVQALLELGRPTRRDAARIKEAILLISSLEPTEADLIPLSSSNIFHVRGTNGGLQWTNRTADFAINDRPLHAQAFGSHSAFLDFTLEEVRSSQSFFNALGMADKHLSVSVIERTEVAGGTPDPALSQLFQSRAFAICR